MRWPLLLLLPIFLGACSNPVGPARQDAPDVRPPSGRATYRLAVDGRTRRYELVLPNRPHATYRYPVVLAFHGAGSTIDSLARASGFDRRGLSEHVLVAYPQGVGARFDTSRGSSDVRFVRALLDDLDAKFSIDRARICATGFSNGAFLCYRLAADLPGTLAAIAPVAGLMARDAEPPAGARTSVLHVHGDRDRVVPASGRAGHFSAAGGLARWAAVLGCDSRQRMSIAQDAAPLRVQIRTHACPESRVELLSLPDTGHTWPQEGDGWLSRRVWRFLRDEL